MSKQTAAEAREEDLALRNLVLQVMTAPFLGISHHKTSANVRFQPGDEWKLEQGMRGDLLPILDQTADLGKMYHVDGTPGVKGSNEDADHPLAPHPDTTDIDNEEAFKEEREGWRGYVEWEDYPEKKKLAARIMRSHKFPPPPDYQLGPLPDTVCSRLSTWHSIKSY